MKFSAFTFNNNSADVEWSSSFEYLLVGGGGNARSAGAGGGGYISGSIFLYPSSTHTYSIGAGAPSSSLGIVASGSSSIVSSFAPDGLLAFGGGGASNIDGVAITLNGGSGGGAGFVAYPAISTTYGPGIPPQGNRGGATRQSNAGGTGFGGGGGAGQVGQDGTISGLSLNDSYGGNGGAGKLWLDGEYYAGGGGGTGGTSSGFGGIGGGGDASVPGLPAQPPGNGEDGKGGGAGGSRSSTIVGKGGDGTFKIRYRANTPKITGGDIYRSGGYWYHTFYGSGSFEVTNYNTGSLILGTQYNMISLNDTSSICTQERVNPDFLYINPSDNLSIGTTIYNDIFLTTPVTQSAYIETSAPIIGCFGYEIKNSGSVDSFCTFTQCMDGASYTFRVINNNEGFYIVSNTTPILSGDAYFAQGPVYTDPPYSGWNPANYDLTRTQYVEMRTQNDGGIFQYFDADLCMPATASIFTNFTSVTKNIVSGSLSYFGLPIANNGPVATTGSCSYTPTGSLTSVIYYNVDSNGIIISTGSCF